MSLDVDSLRCFLAAADTLNFRAASRRVGLSPGAFSDRIRRLEEELGQVLFERTSRRVALTTAGHQLLPRAAEVLQSLDACRAAVRGDGPAPPFSLVLGTRYELGISWLAPALSTLDRTLPERTLHLKMADSPELLRKTRTGELDACITSARFADAGLAYAILHPETYVFVGVGQQVERPEDVEDLTLLDVDADLPLFRYLLDALPQGRPWPFRSTRFLGGIGGIRVRVLAGDGVAVLPRYFVQNDLAEGRLVALLPDVRLRDDAFRLIWRTGHPHSTALVKLAEELRALPLS